VFTPSSVQPEKAQQKEKHTILNDPDKKVNYSKTFFYFSLLGVTVHIDCKNLKPETKPVAYCWLAKENPKL
jgi:hypothetical protein